RVESDLLGIFEERVEARAAEHPDLRGAQDESPVDELVGSEDDPPEDDPPEDDPPEDDPPELESLVPDSLPPFDPVFGSPFGPNTVPLSRDDRATDWRAGHPAPTLRFPR